MARYARIYLTTANSSSYQLQEFQVWGVAAPNGTVSGTVKDSAGPISGASVTLSGQPGTTTDGSGGYSLSVPDGTYTMTVSATGHTTQTRSVTVVSGQAQTQDFTLVVPQANLSQGKTATASKTYSSTYAASKAVDASTSSYWNSGSLTSSTAHQWLQVDLGTAPVSYKRIVVDWNGSYSSSYHAKAYTIQVSTNGTTWTTVYPASGSAAGASGAQTINLSSAQTARYVRIDMTSYNSSSGYRIDEFQVWNY
jgi:hypothetical protein